MTVDFDNDLLLITCASGKQGTDLVPRLYGKWKRLRLQVYTDSSKDRLSKQYPKAEVVQADLTDPRAAAELLDGVTACYLVGPSLSPLETEAMLHIIRHARTLHGPGLPFQHLVYSSVLHPVLHKLLNHDAKRPVEETLIESGLPYTTIQPTHLMENFPMSKILSEDKPVYPMPYNPETIFTWVSTVDVADAVCTIFENRSKHFYATYQFVGTAPFRYTEFVKMVGNVVGKEIEISRIPLLDAAEGFAQKFGGGDKEVKGAAARLLLYYDERGLVGNKGVLEWVMGRETLGVEEWARRKVGELKKD